MAFEWNARAGQYRNSRTKRFVKRKEVLNFVAKQNEQSKNHMQTQARRLVNREISLGHFQVLMIEEIKRANVRMALLASGGKDGISAKEWGAVGSIAREEYKFLRNFVVAISRGELTPERIIWRAGLYGNSSNISFSQAELSNRSRNGVQFAKRFLDAQSAHCPSCIRHERLQWTPINEVTAIATDCECRQRCRCRLQFASPAQAQNILSDSLDRLIS